MQVKNVPLGLGILNQRQRNCTSGAPVRGDQIHMIYAVFMLDHTKKHGTMDRLHHMQHMQLCYRHGQFAK